MGPTQAIITCFRKYVTFSGRATRSEFWWFTGFVTLAHAIWMAVVLSTGFISVSFPMTAPTGAGLVPAAIVTAGCVALFIPWMTVAWRRFHDIGWVGWAFLVWAAVVLFFIRVIGTAMADLADCADGAKHCFGFVAWGYAFTPGIALVALWVGFIIVMSRPSQSGSNTYGPNPHEVSQ